MNAANQSEQENPECAVTQADLAWFRAWAKRHCGADFTRQQDGLLYRRLRTLLRSFDITTVELRRKAEAGDNALVEKLRDAASINYTAFFREPETFDFLRESFFPSLPTAGELRFWSAAASSGDEAYSLAMLALEAIFQASTRVRILGTDLSSQQIEFAERGEYSEDTMKLVSPRRRTQWFEGGRGTGTGARVNNAVRALCTFRTLNLVSKPWPFRQRFHLILLRNVLYYFDEPTQQQVVERCQSALLPGGVLVMSLTDPVVNILGGHARMTRVAPGVFRRSS